MVYGIVVIDGYVCGLTINVATDYVVSEAEYNNYLDLFARKPQPPEGYDYYLRYDTLEWELVEITVNPDYEPTVEDKAEAYDILMGVSE